MKKVLAVLVFAIALGFTGSLKADVADTLLLYFPNRIMDFMDTFSCAAGFGPTLKGRVWVTRAFGFGGGVGATAKAIKQINRQYGAGLESGYAASFMVISAESTQLVDTTRGLKEYDYYNTGIPLPSEKDYDIYRGKRDYWSLGVEAGAVVVEIDGELHPVEIADCFLGIFFIDIKGDDKTADDLRP